MGINYVGANLLTDPNSPFKEFKSIGILQTCSADKLITDSAAAATAIATGYRTNNYYVSVDPLGNPLYTIFELAEKLGLSTGIVVTSSVSHATPGAFVGHTPDRQDQTTIAAQIINQNVEVIIGSGAKYFLPKSLNGERTDGRNIVNEFKDQGYFVTEKVDELLSFTKTNQKIFAVEFGDGLPWSSERNYTLGDLTKTAINSLKNDEDGFILMVEGSQIDWAGHDHKSKELLEEMKDFSTAITEALDFARSDSSTLILVTSDHETGGMAITKGSKDGKELEMLYTSGGHTPSPVGVFAFGPSAELFQGIQENFEIGRKLFFLLDPQYHFK